MIDAVQPQGRDAYVYVIGGEGGPMKVGVAGNVESRRSVLQVASLTPLITAMSTKMPRETAFEVERHAHWLLKASRVRGEWFRVSAAEAVKAVRSARRAVKLGQGYKKRQAGTRVPKDKLEDITLVRFEAGTLDRIDAIAGKNRRARWIREIVEAELKRLEPKRSTPRKPKPSP